MNGIIRLPNRRVRVFGFAALITVLQAMFGMQLAQAVTYGSGQYNTQVYSATESANSGGSSSGSVTQNGSSQPSSSPPSESVSQDPSQVIESTEPTTNTNKNTSDKKEDSAIFSDITVGKEKTSTLQILAVATGVLVLLLLGFARKRRNKQDPTNS